MPLIQPPGQVRLVLGGGLLEHCEKSNPRPGAATATSPLDFICTTTCDPCVEVVKVSDPRKIVGITAITATSIEMGRLRVNSLIGRDVLSWFIVYYLSLQPILRAY